MDQGLEERDILEIIGNGTVSDVEFEDSDEEDGDGVCDFMTPRIPNVEEEEIQDEVFINHLNNLSTVDEIIDKVALGELGLQLNEERRSSVFDYITDNDDITWTKDIFTTRYPPDWDSVIKDIDNIGTPLEYFSKYCPRSLFESAADFTNIYALQQNNSMRPCTASEIETLFGLHIAMGTIGFPRVRMYWNSAIGIDLFLDNMTRDRLFTLRSNLHFVNNLERLPENTDVFYKVRPIYDTIRKRFLELYLCKDLSIDEQMIPFTGNMKAKQYVKGKPNPWGIKNFLLCGNNGLAYDFLLYQGRTTEYDEAMKDFGVGAAVTLKLCDRIDKVGHSLYFDNYFNSYHLLQILKNKQIFAGGTARVNRFHNPPLMDNKEIAKKGRGYAEECVSGDKDVVLCKWQDKRSVIMASNFLSIGECDKVKRWSKMEKRFIDVERPEIIKEYNNAMGGVDLYNRLISYYRIDIRSRKWPLRMIFHAVDMAVTNAWIEYKMDCEQNNCPKKDILDLLEFRLNLSRALTSVGKTMTTRKRGRPASLNNEVQPAPRRARAERRPTEELKLDTVDHLPVHDEKNEPTRCKNKHCGKFRSHWFCQKCKVHLCVTKARNCFKAFHEK